MTFEEWKVARDNSVKFAQETIESMKKSHSELCELLGSTYTKAITDEVRDYNENIMITLIEGDLFQIAAVLNKIAEGSVKAPRVMFKAPEATSRPTWKKEGDFFKCGKCGELSCCEGKFCPECGAKMYIETDKVVNDLMKELTNEDE